jgi:hypothetical protein
MNLKASQRLHIEAQVSKLFGTFGLTDIQVHQPKWGAPLVYVSPNNCLRNLKLALFSYRAIFNSQSGLKHRGRYINYKPRVTCNIAHFSKEEANA